MYLAIDNCTNYASVGLYSNGVIFEETWLSQMQHTATTLPKIEKALLSQGRNFADLKGIACAKGPGSFNGTRAGISLGIGLGMALGIPVVFVSTLEISAFPFKDSTQPIVSLLSAGRGEVYTATFQSRNGLWQNTVSEHISTINEILNGIKEPTIFCGEYIGEVGSMVKFRLGDMCIITEKITRSVKSLFEVALPKFLENINNCPEPSYLRKPPITKSHKHTGLNNQQILE